MVWGMTLALGPGLQESSEVGDVALSNDRPSYTEHSILYESLSSETAQLALDK